MSKRGQDGSHFLKYGVIIILTIVFIGVILYILNESILP